MDENLTNSDEKSKKTEDIPKTGIEKRQENLRPPWMPGCPPPNPNGRPKGAVSLVALMRKIAAAEARGAEEVKKTIRDVYGEDVAEKITNGHLYIAKVHQAAMNGEEWAIKIYLNYLDGMPVQAVNLGGQNGNPIQSQFDFSQTNPDKLREMRDTLNFAKVKNESNEKPA